MVNQDVMLTERLASPGIKKKPNVFKFNHMINLKPVKLKEWETKR